MTLPSLFRRERGRELPIRRESDPVTALRREMDHIFEDFGRSLGLDPVGELWGAYSPSVDVDETDAAKAEFRQGVLTVTLPKSPEARRRSVQIPVQAS